MMDPEAGSGKREAADEGPTLPASRFPLPDQGRLLGIDWGSKRIGLAISDPTQTVATPIGTLTRRAGRRFPMAQLKTYLESRQPAGVVLGLPLEASGNEGPAALAARETGALIAAKAGLPVAFWDERMSTARVLATGREVGGRGRRSGRRGRGSGLAGSSAAPAAAAAGTDALAATALLQAFLDSRRA